MPMARSVQGTLAPSRGRTWGMVVSNSGSATKAHEDALGQGRDDRRGVPQGQAGLHPPPDQLQPRLIEFHVSTSEAVVGHPERFDERRPPPGTGIGGDVGGQCHLDGRIGRRSGRDVLSAADSDQFGQGRPPQFGGVQIDHGDGFVERLTGGLDLEVPLNVRDRADLLELELLLVVPDPPDDRGIGDPDTRRLLDVGEHPFERQMLGAGAESLGHQEVPSSLQHEVPELVTCPADLGRHFDLGWFGRHERRGYKGVRPQEAHRGAPR